MERAVSELSGGGGWAMGKLNRMPGMRRSNSAEGGPVKTARGCNPLPLFPFLTEWPLPFQLAQSRYWTNCSPKEWLAVVQCWEKCKGQIRPSAAHAWTCRKSGSIFFCVAPINSFSLLYSIPLLELKLLYSTVDDISMASSCRLALTMVLLIVLNSSRSDLLGSRVCLSSTLLDHIKLFLQGILPIHSITWRKFVLLHTFTYTWWSDFLVFTNLLDV